MKGYLTPKEVEKRKMNVWKIAAISLFFTLLISLIIILVCYQFSVNENNCSNSVNNININEIYLKHIAATITIFFGSVAGFFITKYHTLKSEAMNERAKLKLYNSEFEDLLRHLIANMKILAKLICELKDSNSNPRVSSVHMANLKWPTSSCLFSDSMAMIIEDDNIESFARLKVNLRNINNSAAYLMKYADSAPYSSEKMRELLEWELTRYFGYYTNFQYMKEHNFKFADNDQLDNYIINNKKMKSELCNVFMDENNSAKREDLVRHYIHRYKDDRRVQRTVILL